jgi:hypothetical protein
MVTKLYPVFDACDACKDKAGAISSFSSPAIHTDPSASISQVPNACARHQPRLVCFERSPPGRFRIPHCSRRYNPKALLYHPAGRHNTQSRLCPSWLGSGVYLSDRTRNRFGKGE